MSLRVLSPLPWVQVNLLRKMHVTGVVTQGASRSGNAEYVKSFKVAYSLNGKKFQFVQEEDDSGDKVRLLGPCERTVVSTPGAPVLFEGPNEARVP